LIVDVHCHVILEEMGPDHPVGEVRALGLGEGEELVLGGNAARVLGIPGG